MTPQNEPQIVSPYNFDFARSAATTKKDNTYATSFNRTTKAFKGLGVSAQAILAGLDAKNTGTTNTGTTNIAVDNRHVADQKSWASTGQNGQAFG